MRISLSGVQENACRHEAPHAFFLLIKLKTLRWLKFLELYLQHVYETYDSFLLIFVSIKS